MGGHKGFGIAMFIEILTSVLLGCPMSTENEVHSWCFELDKANNVSHFFIAINPELISDEKSFISHIQTLINELHEAPRAVGNDRITVPGEGMWERFEKARQKGVELPDDVMAEIRKVEKKCDLSLKEFIQV